MTPCAARRIAHVLSCGFLMLCLCLAWQSSATAQIATATVAGSVDRYTGSRDSWSDGRARERLARTSIEGVTNETGDFVFPNVPGDTYIIRVTMDGFKRLERSGIAVSPGSRVTVPVLTIEVGALNETVLVTGEAPMIQSQSGERSFTITTEAVENLPVANRAFSALDRPHTRGARHRSSRQRRPEQRHAGRRVDDGHRQQWRERNAAAEHRRDCRSSYSHAGVPGGVRPIQRLADLRREQERHETVRGSMYDIERNSSWNSNTWVNSQNGDPKAVLKERDWGYTIGGPIGKPGGQNKLFFFYSHEYRPRTMGGAINRFRVPTELERRGDFSQSTDQNGNLFNLIRDAPQDCRARRPIPAGVSVTAAWWDEFRRTGCTRQV